MAPRSILWLCALTASLALAAEPHKSDTSSTESIDPAVDTSAPTAQEPKPAPAAETLKPGAKATKTVAKDRLELDPTQITGNRELPKVLYIVPWKRSDLGDLPGRPVNSLLDEVLAPVDRDVFKRENRYYSALKPDTAAVKGAEQPTTR